MKISIRKGFNPIFTEQLTRENMQAYYTARGLSWDAEGFLNTLKNYENFQVFQADSQVGTFSLSFLEELCLIRDLQIQKNAQGQGVGTACLKYIQDYTLLQRCVGIGLCVFTENPAKAWYQRCGFIEENSSADVIKMRLDLSTSRRNNYAIGGGVSFNR